MTQKSFLVAPFAGLRPAPEHAQEVAAPPYDVVTSKEARELAADRPNSFLHVSKAEIDLPPETDPFSDAVYQRAKENLGRLVSAGVLRRDPSPCYYVYRVIKDGHQQTGIVAAASVEAYQLNLVRRHELTRPDKEDDRVRQIEAVNGHTGPVFVTHRPNDGISKIIDSVTGMVPAYDVEAIDSARHAVWVVDDQAQITALTQAFDAAGVLYIADGHHRSAAAERVYTARRDANPDHRGNEPYNSFLVVSFPDDEVQILDYNRVVRDLAGQEPEDYLAAVERTFSVTKEATAVRPNRPQEFGMYLNGAWYRLRLASPKPDDTPPVERLDVSILTDGILTPILDIGDPRVDPRIDFVGGARGLNALAERVDSGEWAVAFSLFPASMDDLMSVADAGEILPPKTTWFEPKLADGLVSLMLD